MSYRIQKCIIIRNASFFNLQLRSIKQYCLSQMNLRYTPTNYQRLRLIHTLPKKPQNCYLQFNDNDISHTPITTIIKHKDIAIKREEGNPQIQQRRQKIKQRIKNQIRQKMRQLAYERQSSHTYTRKMTASDSFNRSQLPSMRNSSEMDGMIRTDYLKRFDKIIQPCVIEQVQIHQKLVGKSVKRAVKARSSIFQNVMVRAPVRTSLEQFRKSSMSVRKSIKNNLTPWMMNDDNQEDLFNKILPK